MAVSLQGKNLTYPSSTICKGPTPKLTVLQGMYYFVTHPFLYPLLRARLLPCLFLSVAVLTILFLFTYLPQVALLAIWQGKLAWFNGAFLVLGEGSIIISLLFEAFLVDETQVDVFDAVLIAHDLEYLVGEARELESGEENPVKKLGKPFRRTQYAPFSFRLILECILFLPLNFIPVAGTPLFLVLTGRRAGPFHHWRYFKLLKCFNFEQFEHPERKAFIKARRWQYTWFGTVALVLQLVPVLSMLFLLTTAAGAALWAVKLEEQHPLRWLRRHPTLRLDVPSSTLISPLLERYHIEAHPDEYRLYIVHGDTERLLRPEEKPLRMFKQLDDEGKKPMFMLRRTSNGADVRLTDGDTSLREPTAPSTERYTDNPV